MSQFADGLKFNTTFIVKNNSTNKRVTIFGQPIGPGNSYDLLGIPGVDEAEIKGSLLKGVLLRKLRNNEISVISTDLDLSTFNIPQLSFLNSKNINAKGTDWSAQTAWYFSPTGDDSADGLTSTTPLKTVAAWRKRIGAGLQMFPITLAPGSTVSLNFAAGTYLEALDLSGIRGAIDIIGTETVIASGTLSAYTDINRTSATGWAKLTTTAFDFTSHIGKFYVITSGASTGARGIIESIPGANQAQITPASTLASKRTNPAIVTPTGTETFDIRQVAVFFDTVSMSADLASVLTLTPQNVLWTSLNLIGIVATGVTSFILTGRTHINDCRFDKKSDFTTDLTLSAAGFSQLIFNRCTLASMTCSASASGSTTLQTCAILGASGLGTLTTGGSFFTYSLGVDTLIKDGIISPFAGCRVIIGNVAIHTTAANRHTFNLLNTNGKIEAILLSGGNIYGSISAASTDVFRLGAFCQVIANGVVPVATAGAGGVAVRFGSTTKTFAQLTPNGYMDIVAGAQTAGENGSMWLP